MTDLVKLYNPANAASLTPEQIEGLQKLTSDQIKELAKAYPNMVMQRPYLMIMDSRKALNKQLPSNSSFENLWNLRERNGMRYYVAYAFRGQHKPNRIVNTVARRTEVRDLSDTELMTLPGFKTANTIVESKTVKVTKVKKAKA